MTIYIAGLDLGQSNDYTALSILEKRDGGVYHCRHLQRYKLGTKYPDIVQSVSGIMRREPLGQMVAIHPAGVAPDLLPLMGDRQQQWQENYKLVIDATGVGRPVCDMFGQAGMSFVAVTITGGNVTLAKPDGSYHVCKTDLVAVMQSLLQSGRIKFAKALPEVEILQRELLNFQVKVTDAANAQFGAWREGAHDDMVLSVALAAWYGERCGAQIWV